MNAAQTTADQERGRVLRAWRLHAGLSAPELARRIPATRSAVSMWETGQRSFRITVDRLAQTETQKTDPVAAALMLTPDERAAFQSMCRAAGSNTNGMPRATWTHNFAAPSSPAWVWIRPGAPGPILIKLWWGEPFQTQLDETVGIGGLIVTTPLTIPNPPLEATLTAPGWVDFGTGTIPPGVASALGIEVLDGVHLIEPTTPTTPDLAARDGGIFIPLFVALRRFGAQIGVGWHVLAPHLGLARSDRAPHPLHGEELVKLSPTPGAQGGDRERHLQVTGEQLRRSREAVGLSREAAVDMVTELDPENPFTCAMLRTAERTGRLPAVRSVLSRLDHIYGSDGQLGIERVGTAADHRNTTQPIRFPSYWVGPVWFRATHPHSASGVLDLQWGDWRRRQRIRSGVTVTTRKAHPGTDPVSVTVPAGWTVVAGTGVPQAALDINRGWWPVSPLAAYRLLSSNLSILRAGLRIQEALADQAGQQQALPVSKEPVSRRGPRVEE